MNVPTPLPKWRTSSYSAQSADCVEVAADATAHSVRDSTNPGGPTLVYTNRSWRTFLETIKTGAFDLP
jgi:hypothetical protein|nr:DUF397 domain-containing protein [Actinomadura meyerae]